MLAHLEGIDRANNALKTWLKVNGNSPAALLRVSKLFPGAHKQITKTLQVLL